MLRPVFFCLSVRLFVCPIAGATLDAFGRWLLIALCTTVLHSTAQNTVLIIFPAKLQQTVIIVQTRLLEGGGNAVKLSNMVLHFATRYEQLTNTQIE